MNTSSFLDLTHTIAAPLFRCTEYPWKALDLIGDFINEYKKQISTDEFFVYEDNIIVSKSAEISQKAEILGPCIIGHNTVVRPFAYIRGNAIIGERCVIGNSTEIKNSIVFDGAKLPHYNYVGDSVIGHLAHLGAGVILSNVRSDKAKISVRFGDSKIPTERTKLGSIVGDHAEIGCSCVLNPGSVIGKNATVYPLCCVRGSIPESTILKENGDLVKKS